MSRKLFLLFVLILLGVSLAQWQASNVNDFQLAPNSINGYDFTNLATQISYTVTSNIPVDVYLVYPTEFTKLKDRQPFTYINSQLATTLSSFSYSDAAAIAQTLIVCAVNPSTTETASVSYSLNQYVPPGSVGGSSLSPGAIAGIVIGVFFGVFFLTFIISFLFVAWRRYHNGGQYSNWYSNWGGYGREKLRAGEVGAGHPYHAIAEGFQPN